jgi:gas vesicle protein
VGATGSTFGVGPNKGNEWRCRMSERNEVIEQRGGNFGWFLFSFLLGVLVGAVLALVSAPKSGEESREWLRTRGIELRTRTADLAGKGRERLDEWSERGREQIGKMRGKVEQRVEAPGQSQEGRRAEAVE